MNSLSDILIFSCFFACIQGILASNQKLFVGFGNGSDVAEILNFPSSDIQTPCASKIPEYPLGEVWGTVGLVVEDKIVLCGGVFYTSLDWFSECFALVTEDDTGLLKWEEFPAMERKRGWGSSIKLKDGSWMVLMGEGSYGEMTHTSEIFNISTQSWNSGPEFPISQSGHCAVTLNDSYVFLIGGFGQDEDACFLFNLEDETFQEAPCLQSGGRMHHSCFKTSEGQVAVVGGCKTKHPEGCIFSPETYLADVEFFDPTTNSWSYGPSLDEGVMGATLVPDDLDLLVLGGNTAHGLQDTVYRLGWGESKWDLLDIKLNAKQMYFPAFPIDDSFYNC